MEDKELNEMATLIGQDTIDQNVSQQDLENVQQNLEKTIKDTAEYRELLYNRARNELDDKYRLRIDDNMISDLVNYKDLTKLETFERVYDKLSEDDKKYISHEQLQSLANDGYANGIDSYKTARSLLSSDLQANFTDDVLEKLNNGEKLEIEGVDELLKNRQKSINIAGELIYDQNMDVTAIDALQGKRDSLLEKDEKEFEKLLSKDVDRLIDSNTNMFNSVKRYMAISLMTGLPGLLLFAVMDTIDNVKAKNQIMDSVKECRKNGETLDFDKTMTILNKSMGRIIDFEKCSNCVKSSDIFNSILKNGEELKAVAMDTQNLKKNYGDFMLNIDKEKEGKEEVKETSVTEIEDEEEDPEPEPGFGMRGMM